MSTPIDALTMQETVERVDDAIKEKKQLHHIAINVAKIVHMQTDRRLYDSVVSADILGADGAPLVWVSRLFGKPIPERVTGADLMQELMKLAHQNGYKAFLFGATEEVVRKTVEIYSTKYSPAVIAGFRNGYFRPQDEPSIAEAIANSGADMLFVAITSPKKEIFLHTYKEQLKNVSFIMGVGGTFDVVAGKVKRAPLWMQNMGLEWFYRTLQEPRRMWKRYLTTNTLFLYYLIREIFSPNRILKEKSKA